MAALYLINEYTIIDLLSSLLLDVEVACDLCHILPGCHRNVCECPFPHTALALDVILVQSVAIDENV